MLLVQIQFFCPCGEMEKRIKLLAIGSTRVGKTCVIKRYCEKRFQKNYIPTIGVDYGVARVHLEGGIIDLDIFDTSGLPAFVRVRTEFYSYCDVILLFYDTTVRASFSSLDDFLHEMTRNVDDTKVLARQEFIVVANKTDTPNRAVTEDEGRNWALNRGFYYSEVSATVEESVALIFEELASRALKRADGQSLSVDKNVFSTCTKEQFEALKIVREARTSHERLQLEFVGASSEEISRKFRHLSMLLHPDKCSLPGSEEAFKLLVSSRNQLLLNLEEKK